MSSMTIVSPFFLLFFLLLLFSLPLLSSALLPPSLISLSFLYSVLPPSLHSLPLHSFPSLVPFSSIQACMHILILKSSVTNIIYSFIILLIFDFSLLSSRSIFSIPVYRVSLGSTISPNSPPLMSIADLKRQQLGTYIPSS